MPPLEKVQEVQHDYTHQCLDHDMYEKNKVVLPLHFGEKIGLHHIVTDQMGQDEI